MSLSVLERMRALRVCVIGDAMDDCYVFGHCTRLAQEAPVPIFVPERTERREGGAANVALQLGALCDQVRLMHPRKRSAKTRWIAGTHQVLRMDEDEIAPADWYARLDAAEEVQSADVVILSDYAKGALTEPLCRLVIEMGKPVVVDPKGSSWAKYAGATMICPNEREYAAWDGAHAPPIIVHKRGAAGLTIRTQDGETTVPACAQAVYDVTGAGDVVVAVMAAALGAHMPLTDAAALANRAAGWAVGQVGTTVVPRERFIEWLQ